MANTEEGEMDLPKGQNKTQGQTASPVLVQKGQQLTSRILGLAAGTRWRGSTGRSLLRKGMAAWP